jgi:chromosomal replication initiator protein
VGKTHLLDHCCHRARERHPGISALFLSAEQFTTSFLQALHGGGLPAFRRNCRNVDLLVIDDLQFFLGKRATTVEFQQTIDALQRQGRQLVVSCDRDIADLGDLGEDLVQRLSGGMSARIAPPDAEVRRGIVLAIADRKRLRLPEDVVEFVVTHMTRTARELAGAVNRLEATSHMLGVPVTRGLAEESLADLVRASVRSVRLADIEKAVCSAFGLETGSLQSSRRAKRVNHPRMLAMFLARKHTPAALTEIGSYFGRRSHSTVIAAHKTVASWVSSRSQLQMADARWDADEAIRRVEDLLRTGS